MKSLESVIKLDKSNYNNIWSDSEKYSLSVYSFIRIHRFDIIISEEELVKLIASLFDYLELDSKLSRVILDNYIIEIIKDNIDYNLDYIKIYKRNQYLDTYVKRIILSFTEDFPELGLTNFAQELNYNYLSYKKEE